MNPKDYEGKFIKVKSTSYAFKSKNGVASCSIIDENSIFYVKEISYADKTYVTFKLIDNDFKASYVDQIKNAIEFEIIE